MGPCFVTFAILPATRLCQNNVTEVTLPIGFVIFAERGQLVKNAGMLFQKTLLASFAFGLGRFALGRLKKRSIFHCHICRCWYVGIRLNLYVLTQLKKSVCNPLKRCFSVNHTAGSSIFLIIFIFCAMMIMFYWHCYNFWSYLLGTTGFFL